MKYHIWSMQKVKKHGSKIFGHVRPIFNDAYSVDTSSLYFSLPKFRKSTGSDLLWDCTILWFFNFGRPKFKKTRKNMNKLPIGSI